LAIRWISSPSLSHWYNPSQCLFHRLLHNRLHLIHHIVSGLDDYLIVLGMNNSGVKAIQFLGNIDQRQFKPIDARRLNRQIE